MFYFQFFIFYFLFFKIFEFVHDKKNFEPVHLFFMKSRSLFFVTVNLESEEKYQSVKYWIAQINSLRG